MSKKKPTGLAEQFSESIGTTLEALRERSDREAVAKYGAKAMADADARAAAAAEGVRLFVAMLKNPARLDPAQMFELGIRTGILLEASRVQAARKSGAAAGNGKRSADRQQRDADIRAFHAAAAGTPGERVRATARRFDVGPSTVYAALNADA